MAASSAIFSAFISSQTGPFSAKSSSSSLRLPLPTNVRMGRAVTQATASKHATGTRRPRGIMKPQRVSPEMQAVVGDPEIPRTQALKRIWAYIKERNLQDPENRRVIICDEKLKKIFGGKDRVGFLEVAGLISPHFL
ncbi:protein TRI1-like [Herrania umbratica]|uniref:Protein TRI1-like n=1 Tax=Herrania umbratica TaxID=108875 RepID=A0A6J0ZMU2_9ROSI|nr:protein TRI1-like [Herrania umbratica]